MEVLRNTTPTAIHFQMRVLELLRNQPDNETHQSQVQVGDLIEISGSSIRTSGVTGVSIWIPD